MSRTEKRRNWLSRLLGGPLFSPKGLLVRAGLIALFFLLCHAAGLREYTSIVSGTSPTGDVGDIFSVALAGLYLVAYVAAVLVAPIMLLASAIFTALQLLAPTQKPPPAGTAR